MLPICYNVTYIVSWGKILVSWIAKVLQLFPVNPTGDGGAEVCVHLPFGGWCLLDHNFKTSAVM